MNPPASLQSPWTLSGTSAALTADQVTCYIDVAHPQQGLHDLSIAAQPVGSGILKVNRSGSSRSPTGRGEISCGAWPLSLADVYVRGNDLVASYQSNDLWPYSPQVYWSASPFRDIDSVHASLSVLVSIQTDLLDTRPAVSIVSDLQGKEVLTVTIAAAGKAEVNPVSDERSIHSEGLASCVIQRLAHLPLSYVEIVPTTDFCEAAIYRTRSEHTVLEWRLFAEFLEKGVIRRARVYAAIVPTASDIELAVECSTAILESPPPLTA